ncbi:hypothetical protein LOK49_LG09G01628 [Camellia lanceoleosa]|uniref:Uncharacterized protein n=1 Tax=Camellia lanceoleosa TaxID=1840588 RepID=A0ACC0GF66_9ERIC|nr:hypothetical protein LOK49_LG09G01628 [Camellia lanceoleosa]
MGERRYNILLLAYDKEICPICLESFNFGDEVRFGDPCRHNFHESFFMQLRDFHKCPMCRGTYKRTYTLVIPPKPEEEDAYPPPSPPHVSPPQTPSPPEEEDADLVF